MKGFSGITLHRIPAIGAVLDTIKMHRKKLIQQNVKVIHAIKCTIETGTLEIGGIAGFTHIQWQSHEPGQIAGISLRRYQRSGYHRAGQMDAGSFQDRARTQIDGAGSGTHDVDDAFL
jgi:hypothetical protein